LINLSSNFYKKKKLLSFFPHIARGFELFLLARGFGSFLLMGSSSYPCLEISSGFISARTRSSPRRSSSSLFCLRQEPQRFLGCGLKWLSYKWQGRHWEELIPSSSRMVAITFVDLHRLWL